jgi:hypothetical protein
VDFLIKVKREFLCGERERIYSACVRFNWSACVRFVFKWIKCIKYIKDFI